MHFYKKTLISESYHEKDICNYYYNQFIVK